MTKRVWALALAGLMLVGCGQSFSGVGARSMADMQAAAAKKKAAKNPFLGLTVSVEAVKASCEGCVSISATNGIKLKVAVTYEQGGIEDVSVNRTVLVQNGQLMLTKEQAEPLEWLVEEEPELAATPEERRKKSYLKILDQLASGLKAGKAKKDRAKDVETVVDGLKAFVKAQRQVDESDDLN